MPKKELKPIYGLIIAIPEQDKLITKYCFGDCGKVICAGIDGEVFGPIFPCRQKECPHLDKEIDEPIGDINGHPLFIRKLKLPGRI